MCILILNKNIHLIKNQSSNLVSFHLNCEWTRIYPPLSGLLLGNMAKKVW